MSTLKFNNWQTVQKEVLRRIRAREWKPGEQIPNEADLALEFGCARTTVNRALRNLAQTGLLDRRRKAGTRVARHPVSNATLRIPIIRAEIESKGHSYAYSLISREICTPARNITEALNAASPDKFLHLLALHFADGKPYALEDRWINLATVPDAADETFDKMSSNEWLLENAPFTHGEIAFSSDTATDREASYLGCDTGGAVFVIERATWDNDAGITVVKLAFSPGYRLSTAL